VGAAWARRSQPGDQCLPEECPACDGPERETREVEVLTGLLMACQVLAI